MKNDMKYCNVLIIDDGNMLSNNATGITLRNIWGDWPKEKLMYLNSSFQFENEYDKYFSIIESVKQPIIKCLIHNIRNINRKKSDIISSVSLSTNDKNKTIKTFFIYKIKLYLASLKSILTSENKKVINQFCPEVIYITGASFCNLDIASQVQDFCKDTRTVMHFMDNYIETIYGNTRNGIALRKRVKSYISKLQKNSIAQICISEAMCQAYQREFHIQSFRVMNTEEIKGTSVPDTSTIRIGYAGSCKIGRQKILDTFLDSLNLAARNSKKKVKVYIYSSDFQTSISYNNITLMVSQTSNRDELFKQLSKCTMLLYVESLDEEYAEYTKLSFSTKIPEYLGLQRPILCVAPYNGAVSRYIRENELGICWNSDFAMKDYVKYILQLDRTVIENFSNKEREIYIDSFEPRIMRNNLYKAIMSTA